MDKSNLQKSVPITDYMFSKASRRRIPFSGTFELTPMCNFACKMCYVRKTAAEVKASPRSMMTLDQWLQIAKDACDAGLLHLLLTGGEPTIWPDFWELYEKLSHMGLLISINTNGSMLDKKAIDKLVKNPPRRVNITLYGASDETYEKLCGTKNVFSRVDFAINELKKAGIQLKLNCSLTPYNVCDLEKLVSYAQERELILDVATYMFPPVRRDSRLIGQNDRFSPEESAYYRLKTYCLQFGEEKYQQFLKSILEGSIPPPGLDESCIDPMDGKIKCRAGKASFWITWDGQMTPCGMMTKPAIDIKNRAFIDAWKELTEISNELLLSGVCAKCRNAELCHSCAAMALAETGNISGIPKYLCESVKAMKQIAYNELINNDINK